MRPVPIPDEVIWPGGRRLVMSAPNGDLLDPDIAPVEAIEEQVDGRRVLSVRCALEPGDLEKLAAGGHVWVSFWGGMPPFDVAVSEAPQ